jgi:hypothetical protein
MLLVQSFLETHSFNELKELHGVNARPCKDGYKWSLNYDQIASKPGDPLADQCRGLIVRPWTKVVSQDQVVGGSDVVARPMDRFYNDGDGHAAKIDWTTAQCQEKLDGTMCLLYFDHQKLEWCVATRAVPEADLPFGEALGTPLKESTFAELFKHAVECTLREVYGSSASFNEWCNDLNLYQTHIYELTSPLNRVVVKYETYRVTLLASRYTFTGKYQMFHNIGPDGAALQLPSVWPLNDIGALSAFVNNSDPSKIEGAVVVDAQFNRVKVKNKLWVLASRAKDALTMSARNALETIIDGTVDDVLPLLDEPIVKHIEEMRAKLVTYCTEIDGKFMALQAESEGNRKTFALKVQATQSWCVPFYELLKPKHTSCLAWLQTASAEGRITDSLLDSLLENMQVTGT